MAHHSSGREFDDASRLQKIAWRSKFFTSTLPTHGLIAAILGLAVLIIVHFGVREWDRLHSTTAPDVDHSSADAASLIGPIEVVIGNAGRGPRLPADAISRIDQILSQSALSAKVSSFVIIGRDKSIAYARDHSRIGGRWSEATFDAATAVSNFFAENAEIRGAPIERATYHVTVAPLQQPDRYGAGYLAIFSLRAEADEGGGAGVFFENKGWLIMAALTALVVALASRNYWMPVRSFSTSRPAAPFRPGEPIDSRSQSSCIRDAPDIEEDLLWLRNELHDGPAQALALALLRMDEIQIPSDRACQALDTVRTATKSALEDIRSITDSLTFSPNGISSVTDTITKTVDRFTFTHRASVETEFSTSLPDLLSGHWSDAIGRFVYECLRFNFRIEKTRSQRVTIGCYNGLLCITVACPNQDDGILACSPSTIPQALQAKVRRIESLGGRVEWRLNTDNRVHMNLVIPIYLFKA